MEGSRALDATGHEYGLSYEDGIAFFLPGPELAGLSDGRRISRAVHLAGGRLAAGLIVPTESYSIEMWFWNGLPNDARQVTGYLFARSSHGGTAETLGLGGSSGAAGRAAPGRRRGFRPCSRSGA